MRYGTDADFSELDRILHGFRGMRSGQPLTEQEAAEQDVRFHDAVYRAAHHARLYTAWSAIRSQVYVLLLGRNVADQDFREDTYVGHLELAYLIRARDEERVVTAAEQHLAASYARVLASYPAERADPRRDSSGRNGLITSTPEETHRGEMG